jgi:hypothetical protein
MPKRIAFIQTGAIGDLLMILPIVDHYQDLGWEIVWPVDRKFLAMFGRAKPSVLFVPVDGSPSAPHDYFLGQPLKIAAEHDCEKTIMFYLPMRGFNIGDPRLAHALKFDEYKYAMAGVPFRKKWDLKYERDLDREQQLFDSLNIDGPYVCVHGEGSDAQLPVHVPTQVARDHRVIPIDERSDSIFDWRLTLERASHLYLIDSCFANLVEQLNLPGEKTFLFRSQATASPVLRNKWNFAHADPSDLTNGSFAA